LREAAFAATSFVSTSPVGYVFPSHLVPVLQPVTEYAGASFSAGVGILAGAVDLMHRIRTGFKYDPKATVISTPLTEVFEKRNGVCQDFAHVMIAGLRGLGLPAAYVSGYLRTYPPPGQPRMVGADASHAWVSAYCPEIGWIDVDPTNNVVPSTGHVTIAWGRDFGDVSPLHGMILGGGAHTLKVGVDLEAIES
jgi:transglutaminase-like putative cysteine protease